jgi:transmembrane sensor
MKEHGTALERTKRASRESAAHWLATLETGDCSEDERREFIAWLRASTLNVEEFLRTGALLHRLGDMKLWPGKDIAALIEEARAPASVERLPVAGRASTIAVPTIRRWAMAASIAGLLAIGGLAWRHYAARDVTYSTLVGEQRSVQLPDGSHMQLNTHSTVATAFEPQERHIRLLEGEALFHVAKDPGRPFIVDSADGRVVAVGTAFNVRADSSKTTITVVEGRVRVSGASGAATGLPGDIYVSGGEQVVIARGAPQSAKTFPNTDSVTAWTKRKIVFENTTMSEAVAEFSRYDAKRVVLVDEKLRSRRISGVFASNDLQSLVQFLASDPRIEVKADDSGWTARLRPEQEAQ